MSQKKLEEMPNLKIIGITGSYGKTSTKYALTTLLKQKYNDYIDLKEAILNGLDPDRPLMEMDGFSIRKIADSFGL